MRTLFSLVTVIAMGALSPALAQDQRTQSALHALGSDTVIEKMTGAAALCLLGALDANWTIAAFTSAQWREIERFEDLVTLSNGEMSVMIQQGTSCRVSANISTRKAMRAALDVFPLISVDMRSEGSVMNCSAMLAQETFYVSINSGGQDPTCESEKTSDIIVVPAR